MDPSSRGREVASGVLRSPLKPEKRSIFLHRRDDNGCRLFSAYKVSTIQSVVLTADVFNFCKTTAPIFFLSDAWPAPATYHLELVCSDTEAVPSRGRGPGVNVIFLRLRQL